MVKAEEFSHYFEEGIRLFNEGKFFEAHDQWEKIWLRAGEEKKFLQGLIQVAVGYYHHSSLNLPGAVMMLERGCGYLSGYESGFLGLDSAELIREAESSVDKIKNNRKFDVPQIHRTDAEWMKKD